jgi:F-type H+-transporting ATPase subunit b
MSLNQIFSLDPGSVFWTLITFAILLFVLGKFAWGPILSGLKAREDGIQNDIEGAKKERETAESTRKEYETSLNEARNESQKLVSESRDRAKKYEADQLDQVKTEVAKLKTKAAEEIELQNRQALQNMQSELVDLTLDAAEKLIQKSLDRADHEGLIKDSLKGLGQS